MRKKLLEENARCKVLAENFPQRIFLKDKNSVYIFCNENYAQDLKIRAEKIKGKTDYDFFPKELAEKYRADDKRIIEKGEKEGKAGKYIQNGKEVFVNIIKIPLKDKQDRAIALLGIFNSSTEHKRAEEILWKSKERFSDLGNNTYLLICTFLSDSTLTYVNKAYSDYFKKCPEELIGRKFLDFVPAFERKAVKANYMSLTPGVPSHTHEHKVETEAGVKWQEWTNQAFFKDNGKISYFQAIGRDITERKRIESMLQEEHQRLEYVLESTGTGIDVIDADYNLCYVNESWQKIYGNPSGRKCYEYYMGRDKPCLKCGIPKALKTKKIITTEEQLPKEKNKIVEVRSIPFQNAAGQWLVAEVNIDITKRKKMEQRMEAAYEKLKNTQNELVRMEKLAALGQLSGIVAHDLRNPLAVIRNSAYLLKKSLKGSKDTRVKRCLKLLDEEIDIADSIIEEALSFTRMKNVKISSFDLNVILEKVLTQAKIPKSIKIEKKFGKKSLKMKGDREQLQRLFTNLIRNGVEAMGSKGKLAVKTIIKNKSVLVEISDTGAGINKKDIDKIFEPMCSTKIQGTGLGLPACKNIIEAHKGHISIESKEAQGTTFSVVLPLWFDEKKKPFK